MTKNKIPVGMHPDDLMHCDHCGGLVEYVTVDNFMGIGGPVYVCIICRTVLRPKVRPPQSAKRARK